MDPHVKARLTKVLDAEGLDALVASTTENLQYVTGFRSIAHALFRGIELYVSYGNGQPGPFDDGFVPSDDLEGWIADQNKTFVGRLDVLDIPVEVDAYGPGSHSWPYWERALHQSLPLLLEALAP